MIRWAGSRRKLTSLVLFKINIVFKIKLINICLGIETGVLLERYGQ